MELLLIEVADRIATLTLNRPRSRNALNLALMHALWDAVAGAGANPDVDVVIITGAGPAFCAGVDLKEAGGEVPPSAAPRAPGEGPERGANGLFRFIPVIDKPVLAAINGVCVTGGLELALQCHLIIASDQARFADTHARVGVMPGGGMTVLLARAIGERAALEWSLTGNFAEAAEAHRLGLVNHVVPHDELLARARALAADIAGNDQVAVRRLVQHYRALAAAGSLDEAHAIEGVMAETWAAGTRHVAERRAAVSARGRDQIT